MKHLEKDLKLDCCVHLFARWLQTFMNFSKIIITIDLILVTQSMMLVSWWCMHEMFVILFSLKHYWLAIKLVKFLFLENYQLYGSRYISNSIWQPNVQDYYASVAIANHRIPLDPSLKSKSMSIYCIFIETSWYSNV